MRHLAKSFALCVDNTDYKASLIPGKVYRIIPGSQAAKDDVVRIVDESGEDYLYTRLISSLSIFHEPLRRGLDRSKLLLPN
jgi:hypothetical protein